MTKFTSIENALKLCVMIGEKYSEHLSFELTENDTVILEGKTLAGFCEIEVGFYSFSYIYEKAGKKGCKDHVAFVAEEAEALRKILAQ